MSNFMAHLSCAICGQHGEFGAEQPKVTCTSWNTTTVPCPNCVLVKALDKHIEEARAYIRHLKAHRATLRRGANTFHDPFTTLVPPEIASKIFSFCVDGEEFKRRIPLVLSAVSKRWQVIAHSTPLLWASIRLGAYPRSSRYSYEDMLRHWLKRSSQYPLSIDLQASSFTHYTREELENQYRPIIEILNAHCHRWRKLSVAMPLYLLGLLRGNFIGKPLLSHLEIRGDDLDDHDDEDSQTWKFDLGTALPAPHRVSISECRPQRIHINWCNVTDLFLALLRPQEIFALLKAAPLLRECRLSGLLPDVQAASSYQDQDLPVVHHNLIKFTVEIWDVPLSPLFDGLCFPNLNSLFYSGSYASMTPHASFLVRSSCPIKSLTIHLSSDSDHSAELSDILWAVPTLERLDIEGVCVFDNFFQLLADDKGGFKRRRFLPSLMEISQAGSQSWAGMFTWKDISKAVEARASQHRAEGGLPVLKRFRWELHMLPEFDDRFYIDEGSVRVFEQLRADGIDIQLTNHYNKEGRRDMITYSRAYHQARHEREKKQSTSDG